MSAKFPKIFGLVRSFKPSFECFWVKRTSLLFSADWKMVAQIPLKRACSFERKPQLWWALAVLWRTTFRKEDKLSFKPKNPSNSEGKRNGEKISSSRFSAINASSFQHQRHAGFSKKQIFSPFISLVAAGP